MPCLLSLDGCPTDGHVKPYACGNDHRKKNGRATARRKIDLRQSVYVHRNLGERAVERVVGGALGAKRLCLRCLLNCFTLPVVVYPLYAFDVANGDKQTANHRNDAPELHGVPSVGGADD